MKKRSFRTTVYTSFFLTAFLPLLIIGAYYYWSVNKEAAETINSYVDGSLRVAARLIDDNTKSFLGTVDFLATHEEVSRIIAKDNRGEPRDFDDTQSLYSITRSVMANQPMEIPIHIINAKELSRYSTTNYYAPIYMGDKGNFFERMRLAYGHIVTQTHRRVDGENLMNIDMIVGQAIIDKETKEIIGYVVMDIYDQYYQSVFDTLNLTAEENIYVLDAQGAIITDRNLRNMTGFSFNQAEMAQMQAPEGEFSLRMNGKDYMGRYCTASYSNFRVLSLVPSGYMRTQSEELLHLVTIIVFIALLFSAALIYFCTKRIFRPVQELAHEISKMEGGDLEVRVSFDGEDEMGRLGRGFNSMVREIRRLVEEDYKKQLLLEQAKFRALQSQVNPHFLYNTLNSINWMAKLGKNEDVSDMTQALSDFFRYNVDNSRDFTTIREEIQQIRNYLAIQQYRYKNQLETNVSCQPELEDLEIPAFLLQPLVENAFVHGLEQAAGPHFLQITCYRQGQRIVFKVCDNGVGLGNSTSKGMGVGINNINQRIRFFYGEGYGVTAATKEEKTAFVMELPYGGIKKC